MRVTSNFLMKNMLNNLSRNNRRLDEVTQQLSTGKRINKPSDDPGDVVRSLRVRTEINEYDQYKKNVDMARSLLEYTDETLDKVGQGIHRARELAIQAKNDTYDDSQREMMAKEVNGILNDIVDASNSTFSNRHVFSGTSTKEPFKPELDDDGNITKVNPEGNSEPREFEMGVGQSINAGADGQSIFMPIFDGLINLRDGLEGKEGEVDEDLLETGFGQINESFDALLTQRSELGARVNQLELVENRMLDGEINLKGLKSSIEDVDMAESIMHLKNIEALHQASLNVTSRIIQPSLVDFLR
ncbi:flagellar hook-associated protein FlgL [Proteinivorax hydrogeniformans]|uniref:Flagellar hook-associated protein FlgL n=1 Tax=Proteinivorax hydrogeniformans TaxID=1826727 RepID=A0AAU8HUW3_9FIRM